MNCKQAHHLFDAHLDGELTGTLLFELETHLLHCPACQRAYQVRLTVGEIIRHDRNEPVLSVDFADRVMDAVRSSKVKVVVGRDERHEPDTAPILFPPLLRRRLLRVLMPLSAAAAVLLFVFLPLQGTNKEPSGANEETGTTPLAVASMDGASSIVDHVGKAMKSAHAGATSLGWVASVSWPNMLTNSAAPADGVGEDDSGPI